MTDLSPRQAQLLAAAANGMTRVEMAQKFLLSPWTVDNVFKETRRRLEARTNPQAVALAIASSQLFLEYDGTVIAPVPDVRLLSAA